MNTDETMLNAMSAIWQTFYKVLKINLTTDQYEIIKIAESETAGKAGFRPNSIFGWLKSFVDSGQVYEADTEIYRSQTTPEFLKKHFSVSDRLRVRYRRRTENGVRWVFLEILKNEEYTESNQILWLYVRDIHDSYVKELENLRELELCCKYDTLTGLNNYFSYQQMCMRYTGRSSVGVIFADMNGLKLTNDRFGHSAGNELLREFSKSLLYQFSSENIFRISGDEFLIVLFGLTEVAFTSIADQYFETIQADEVPKASVGYAWKEEPKFIEDVAKMAESRMYVDKDAFYEKHSEYKRGLAAETYRREINAVIQNLANTYDVMGTVDLNKDSYWILKTFEGPEQIIKKKTYSEFRQLFMERVKPDFRKLLEHFGSVENLRTELEKVPSLTCEYQSIDDTWVRLSFRLLEKTEDKPSKAMFLVEKVDRARSERLDRNEVLEFEHSIIEGLAKDYSMISIIDVSRQKFQLYKNYALSEDVASAVESLAFDNARLWFCKTYVLKEDQQRFMEITALSNLQNRLQQEDIYRISFGTTPEFHHDSVNGESEFLFYRLNSDPNKIVFVTKRLK